LRAIQPLFHLAQAAKDASIDGRVESNLTEMI